MQRTCKKCKGKFPYKKRLCPYCGTMNVLVIRQQSEARVQGILRGGYLFGDLFMFHSGTMKIETKSFSELKIL